MHTKWTWRFYLLDICNVFDINAVFGPSLMFDGPGATNGPATVWHLMSTDADGNGINGVLMNPGGVMSLNANFNLMTDPAFLPSAVPEPVSLALLGSGITGLLGLARKRK